MNFDALPSRRWVIPAALVLSLLSANARAADCNGVTQCDAACAQRVPNACTRAGKAYEAKKDLGRAAAAYQAGCELGDGPACHRIAEWLQEGIGYPKDPARADPFLARACELNFAKACVDSGMSAESGRAGFADFTRAAANYYRACQAQEVRGCTLLGRLYMWGVGVENDPPRAATYFKLACDRKDGPACFALASMRERGAGGPRDEAAAKALYKQAAALGAKSASLQLPQVGPSGSAMLTITSAPSGATVAIDGLDGGKTPVNLRLPSGEHVVRLEVPGRTPAVRSVQLVPGQSLVLDMPFPVTLEIVTIPPGAQLFMDGRELGTSPWTGEQLPGPHALEARLAGFEPAVRPLRLEGTKAKETLRLERAPARLVIDSVPPGAEVELDGKRAGITPFAAVQKAGPVTVKVKSPGFEPFTQKLTLKNGELSNVTAKMRPEEVALKIASSPSGATVSIDGLEVGKTPFSGKVPVGTHSLQLELLGYQGASESLEVPSGSKTISRKLDLSSEPIALSVTTDPPGAEVLVDGQAVGTSPWRGTVSAGAHRITARAAGFAAQERSVTAKAGPPLELSFKLSVEAARPPTQLAVTSVPPGADVEINGAKVGVTPYAAEQKPGAATVKVKLAGFNPFTQKVTVKAGEQTTVNATLKAEEVAVKLTSKPSGAKVSVDGVEKGKTPFSGKLAVGERTVVLTLDGHQTLTRKLSIASGSKPITEKLELVKAPVQLSVVSEPPGATVTIDAQEAGVTPFRGALPLGPHTVSVKADRFEPQEQKVVAKLGPPLELSFKLSATTVPVEVKSDPPGATIRIGGEAKGVTPLSLNLPAGNYLVDASMPGFADTTQPFVLQQGVPGSWNLVLAPRPLDVEVVTDPAGATVSINGQPVGLSPMKLPLGPGIYRVSAALAGHKSEEAEFTLAPGAATASWTLVLPPDAPGADFAPPPPPPTASNETDFIDQLRSPTVTLDAKRGLLKTAAATLENDAFGRVLMAVEPESQRGTLCPEFDWKAPKAVIQIKTKDSFGDDVVSEVFLDGKSRGNSPFLRPVPACSHKLVVEDVEDRTRKASAEVRLSAGETTAQVTTRFPGRPSMFGVHLVGEYFDERANWPGVFAATGGLRLDYYGRVFYFGLTGKGGYNMGGTSASLGLSRPPAIFPYPMLDVSVGFDPAISIGNAVRFHLIPAVGTWHSVYPAGRVILGINIVDRVMLTGQAQAVWDTRGFTQFDPTAYSLMFGAGLGVLLH